MPNYILEESAELAKEARLYLKGIHDGLDLKKVLSRKQYIVFYFKIVKNYPTSVIADIVGVTESTVRVHYHRAIKKTKKIAQNM